MIANSNMKLDYGPGSNEEEFESLTGISDSNTLNSKKDNGNLYPLIKRKSITPINMKLESTSNDTSSKDDSGIGVDFNGIVEHNPISRREKLAVHNHNNNQSRLVTKYGHINIKKCNVERRKWFYLVDVFTTLLEISWKWTLLAFCIAYFGSWLLFALGWYAILYFHDDLNPINFENENGTWKPCIAGIPDFTSTFLFSLETQHTTGYGFYQLTSECPDAIILLCIQSIVGTILEGIFVGLVFVKISRAKRRRATLMFSRNAVISKRDGKTYFMFRVADMRKNHLLEPRIRAQFIQKRKTQQGEFIRESQQEIYVHGEGENSNRLFLLWPTIVIHEINSSSPFYKMTQEDLLGENISFEVIIILEGTVESTGHETQARTSYLQQEILWDHYFYDLNERTGKSQESGERIIDFSLFHETYVPGNSLL